MLQPERHTRCRSLHVRVDSTSIDLVPSWEVCLELTAVNHRRLRHPRLLTLEIDETFGRWQMQIVITTINILGNASKSSGTYFPKKTPYAHDLDSQPVQLKTYLDESWTFLKINGWIFLPKKSSIFQHILFYLLRKFYRFHTTNLKWLRTNLMRVFCVD